MKDKGPGKFETEFGDLESRLMLTTVERAVAWAQSGSIWPDTFGLACCAIEMMSIVSARYDIARLRSRGLPRFSAPVRPADRVRQGVAQDGRPLRQIYDQMLEPKWVIAMGACASSGGMLNNYAILQGVDRIVAVDIDVPGCPPRPEALVEGICRLQEKIKAGVSSGLRAQAGRDVSWQQVPGYVSEKDAYGETTVMIERERIADAAVHMRDTEGFNMLSDVSAADYLGWGEIGVAGYWGAANGRDTNAPAHRASPVSGAEAGPFRRVVPPPRNPRGEAQSDVRSGARTDSRCDSASRCGRRQIGTSERRAT